MGEVVVLDDFRAQVYIEMENCCHIIPVKFLEEVLAGKKTLQDVPIGADLERVAVAYWLALIGVTGKGDEL